MCLECTFLGAFVLPMPDFQKQLFGLSSIQSYINRSKSNVLICEFDYDEAAQALSTSVAVPPMSQLSQLSQDMTQYSANPLSQYAVNPLNLGVYNFDIPYGMPYGQTKPEVPIGFGFGPLGPNM